MVSLLTLMVITYHCLFTPSHNYNLFMIANSTLISPLSLQLLPLLINYYDSQMRSLLPPH